MIKCIEYRKLPVLLFCFALASTEFGLSAAWAQQFRGFGRSICDQDVTIEGTPLTVRAFESRSSNIGNPTIRWKCGAAQRPDVQCPPNTNKVLVDRSQGGRVVSIICLQK
jgi:hypothetical protein